MLKKNTKLFLSKQFAGCNIDLNVEPSTIVAEIISANFALEIRNSKDIQFDNVLYITDLNLPNDTLDLKLEDWLQTETYTNMEMMTFPKNIRSMNAFSFADQEPSATDIFTAMRNQYNFIIVGPINNIPEAIFDRICGLFNNRYIIFYGDSLVNANDQQNYHLRYLSNSTFSLSFDYDVSRISSRKKINGLLHKLRKDKTQIEDITTSPWVSVDYSDLVDPGIILQHLEEHPQNTCILPLRLYSYTTSKCYCLKYGDDITLTEGRTYYLKDSWLYQDMRTGETKTLDPMTAIQIGEITSDYRNPNTGKRYLSATIILQASHPSIDGSPAFTIIPNCVLDVSDYVANFNYEDHPANYEEFAMLQTNYWSGENEHDYRVLKISPFRIVIGEQAKRFNSHETLCFIESLERNLFYKTDRNWFKYFVRTKEKVKIIHCDEFQNR